MHVVMTLNTDSVRSEKKIFKFLFQDNKNFPIENVDKAAKYLATKTFESLNEMFTASQQIQVLHYIWYFLKFSVIVILMNKNKIKITNSSSINFKHDN